MGVILNENPTPLPGTQTGGFPVINPSVEINGLVARHMGSLPRRCRVLRMTGATPAGGGTSGQLSAV